MQIPFNKPCILGDEINFIKDAISRSHLSGNGYYTKQVHNFFQTKYGLKNAY
mgnify:CR=1 FL=1